ncbi:MAG: hypothetical protein HY562_12455 [Ignavibacteriales bacterium]|nr:hypothetical protein [Ignavibacteriales bacterium]
MRPKQQNIAKVIKKVLACVTLVVPALFGQTSSAKQVLTLQVLELNKIDLVGTNLTLTINSVEPGDWMPSPEVNTNTTLVWTSNCASKKISVASSNASSRFALKVSTVDLSPGAGLTTSEVSFSDDATRDLIVGVGKSAGKCQLRFTAVANEKQGTGADAYVITFTITSS